MKKNIKFSKKIAEIRSYFKDINLGDMKKYLIGLIFIAIILVLSYLVILNSEFGILTFAFIKSNLLWLLVGVTLITSSIIYIYNWRWVNAKSWSWKNKAFLLVSLVTLIEWGTRPTKILTEVQAAKIRAEYQADFDNLKSDLKTDYKISEKKFKNEISELKKSNEDLLAKQLEVVVDKNCDDKIALLVKNNQELKDQVVSLKITKSKAKPETDDQLVVTKPPKRAGKTKPCNCPPVNKKLSVAYSSPGDIRYTGRKY